MTLPATTAEILPPQTDSSVEAVRWGRDLGPAIARNTSKGALIGEAHAVFRALAASASITEIHTACLNGRLLRQVIRETRRNIWKALNWRYFIWNPPRWVLSDLATAAQGDATAPHLLAVAHLHYAYLASGPRAVMQALWESNYSALAPTIEKFIDELLKHYTDTLRLRTTEIGSWISGYFGSGESHLAKILALLVENRVLQGHPANKRFEGRIPPTATRRAAILRSLGRLRASTIINARRLRKRSAACSVRR